MIQVTPQMRIFVAVEPVDFPDIDGQLQRNLGKDWRSNFESFNEQPLASASIGQVHEAVLNSGQRVVLKIQRPGIKPKIESDLNILHTASGYLEEAFPEAHIMDLRGMVRDFAKSLAQELDYRIESNNMERFRRNFAGHPDVHIPEVFKDLSTEQVLTMEFVEGKKFDRVIEEGRAPTSWSSVISTSPTRCCSSTGSFTATCTRATCC
ncbi:MAG: AarF/ABC1/UbiB kinase family protein [Deltaproteobacteria bacterium]|nr:AarF/ABC1/UbiB kinase family protein [Deltaproteobacteria bacterium]